MKELVSVIIPVYNAEQYIAMAVSSVFHQDYENWELIIVNDGSTDATMDILSTFNDSRISVFDQENRGVSAARNFALKQIRGDFFCFLDADDVMTTNSLSSRLSVFQNAENVSFVDGIVEKWNHSFTQVEGIWRPNYKGNPFTDLLRMTGSSFFGPSWMIKRDRSLDYKFESTLTHGEDLLFFLTLSRDRSTEYSFTEEKILKYRVHSDSAMRSGLKKLENGYLKLGSIVEGWTEVAPDELSTYYRKVKSIMFKSFLRRMRLLDAFKILTRQL